MYNTHVYTHIETQWSASKNTFTMILLSNFFFLYMKGTYTLKILNLIEFFRTLLCQTLPNSRLESITVYKWRVWECIRIICVKTYV